MVKSECETFDEECSSKESVQMLKLRNIMMEMECPQCSLMFLTEQELMNHQCRQIGNKLTKSVICGRRVASGKSVLKSKLRPKYGKWFACEVCGRRFPTNWKLELHKRMHTGEKPFACNNCDARFAKKESLKIHMFKHTGEKPFTCDVCDKGFVRKDHLMKHRLTHYVREKPYECGKCGKLFADKWGMKNHERIHSGVKPFKCDVCEKRFRSNACLKVHSRRHTGEKPYKCDACDRRFISSPSMKIHKRQHAEQEPYQCSHCHESFKQGSLLEAHSVKHVNGLDRFPCPVLQCPNDFRQYSDVYVHLQEKHIIQVDCPASCKCCSKVFAEGDPLLSHFYADHSLDQGMTKMGFSRNQGLDNHRCERRGGRPCKSDEDASSHASAESPLSQKSTHAGEKRFNCKTCGKRFLLLLNLKRHMRAHSAEKRFVCGVCGCRFEEKSSLKIHMLEHPGERPFACDVCGKRFFEARVLKAHQLVHTGEKAFKCDVCAKRFSRSDHLMRHKLTHGARERSYECDKCGKRFFDKGHMEVHKVLHSEIRPFKCEVCERQFHRKDNLEHHRIVHTREEPYKRGGRQTNSSRSTKRQVRLCKKEEPYHCSYCSETFKKRILFVTHSTEHIQGLSFFSCPISGCSKEFEQYTDIYIHLRKEHIIEPNAAAPCKRCDKKFTHANLLLSHFYVDHPPDEAVRAAGKGKYKAEGSSTGEESIEGLKSSLLQEVAKVETKYFP